MIKLNSRSGILLIKFKVLHGVIPVVFSAVVGEVVDLRGGTRKTHISGLTTA